MAKDIGKILEEIETFVKHVMGLGRRIRRWNVKK